LGRDSYKYIGKIQQESDQLVGKSYAFWVLANIDPTTTGRT